MNIIDILVLLVLAFNAVRAGCRRPKPGPGLPAAPQKAQAQYAQGLGQMLACATAPEKGGWVHASPSGTSATSWWLISITARAGSAPGMR